MVEVARSPSMDDAPGNPAARPPPEPVLLPPNEPGRIDNTSISSTSPASGSRSRPLREDPLDVGPAVNTEEQLQRIGREEAAAILPTEMSMMLPVGSPGFSEVALMCDKEHDALDDVWRSFVDKLIDLLWAPPGGILSRLPGLSENDVRAKMQLFWRCSVALCVMPLPHLRMLSQRKAKICPALASCLPEDGASPPAERLAHLRLNLPVFSMVADMPREEKPPSPPVCASQESAAPGVASTALEEDEDDEVIIEEVTASTSNAPTESKGSGPRPSPATKLASADKENSAARHTYDLGYKKWENFDVDSAIREVDRPEPLKQKVDIAALRQKEARQDLDFDDPVQALSKVIEESEKRQAAAKASEAASDPVESATESAKESVEAPRDSTEADKPAAPATSEAGVASKESAPLSTGAATESAESSRMAQAPVCDPNKGGASVEASSTALLDKGTRVVIHGTSREDLNGLSGEVIACDEKAGRMAVALPDGRQMRFRPAHLQTEAAQEKAPSKPKEDVPESSLPEMAGPEAATVAETETLPGESTAAALTNDYAKWETYDDCEDVDEIDEDELDAGMDLDALTGPKEEVARIRSHWKREMAAQRRRTRAEERKKAEEAAARRAELRAKDALAEGPVTIHRPCQYRPSNDPTVAPAKAIHREYNKWRDFDADKAILELDNDGKTEEGDAMRCEARKGSAMITAEGYKKDREEYDLDQDIEKQMGGLKKVIAQRLKDASTSKAEGNALLQAKKPKEACEAYQRGLEVMDLCSHAAVIMADSMADKNTRLIADLHRNLAAAQLEVGDYEGARASCDAILKPADGDKKEAVEDEKARYRRAVALLRLGRIQDSERDIAALAAIRGEDDAVVQRLRNEAGAKSKV